MPLSPESSSSSTASPDTAIILERSVTEVGETSSANEGAVFRPGMAAEGSTDETVSEDADGIMGEPDGDRNNEDGPLSNDPDTQGELAPEKREELRELQSRDQEVRQHEQAHLIVGGPYTGTVNYTLERGPDGQLYAVDGEVPIDTAPIPEDPEATIDKMRIVRAAALAPSEPSPEDLQVALEATRQMLAAQGELRAERQGEVREDLLSTEERDRDPRIEVFRDVAATQDPPDMQDAGTRVDAIA